MTVLVINSIANLFAVIKEECLISMKGDENRIGLRWSMGLIIAVYELRCDDGWFRNQLNGLVLIGSGLQRGKPDTVSTQSLRNFTPVSAAFTHCTHLALLKLTILLFLLLSDNKICDSIISS